MLLESWYEMKNLIIDFFLKACATYIFAYFC